MCLTLRCVSRSKKLGRFVSVNRSKFDIIYDDLYGFQTSLLSSKLNCTTGCESRQKVVNSSPTWETTLDSPPPAGAQPSLLLQSHVYSGSVETVIVGAVDCARAGSTATTLAGHGHTGKRIHQQSVCWCIRMLVIHTMGGGDNKLRRQLGNISA